jgi:hypothetical protein
MKLLVTIVFALGSITGFCQTWSDDIAAVVYNKCASCHRPGGIAPFSLLTYDEAAPMAEAMYAEINHGHMPPWPADPDYRHFANENVMTDAEKSLFEAWVLDGWPEGNPANAPEPPTFPMGGSLLETIDLTVAIEPYTLQYNTDEYRWFVVHTNFPEPVYISKIEVMPGLQTVVHHADISYDITGISSGYDDTDPVPGFNSQTGAPNYSYYINAWQPGGNIAAYPDEWGVAIPPGADFVIEIHYGPGGIGQTDTTKFNLQFLPENVQSPRPVNVGFLLYDSPPCLVDGPLVIPANQQRVFHQQSAPLSGAISIVSICPHMHLLGKSYKVWAITAGQDSIPLIDIPHWDFHWQKYYTYPSIQVLPPGTVIHSEGWYDNTTNNVHNPHSPPQTVVNGPYTTDEMFLCYFIYTSYEAGDEYIVLDSATWQLGLQPDAGIPEPVVLFPNPAQDQVTVSGFDPHAHNEVLLFDSAGKLLLTQVFQEKSTVLPVTDLPGGVYIVRWESETTVGTAKLIVE